MIPENIQKILDEKKDQLDKAIKFYQAEQDKINSSKKEFEQ